MYKALVIGCGNIGAMYDFENNEIQTHTKALVLNGNFQVKVFDIDKDLAQKVAQKYQIQALKEINQIEQYDLISICTPTDTHISYLNQCLKANTKVVICEKPISYDKSELLKFAQTKLFQPKTKILVNYIRNFQPHYIQLKEDIKQILQSEQLSNIHIKYYKGFINYASHALSLLEFLFDKPLYFTKSCILDRNCDFFSKDATINAIAFWDFVPLHIAGLLKTNFSIFEVEIYFQNHKILIKSAGQTIEIYQKDDTPYIAFDEKPTKIYRNCLRDYMKFVILKAQELLEKPYEQDNFEDSFALNQFLLNFVEENGNYHKK